MMYVQQKEHIRVNDNDILCGRGKAFAHHPGNVKFTQKIQSNLQKYRDAPKRFDRSIVLATLVDEFFEEGCRFLKKNKATNSWVELNPEQCHEKVGHALRDLHRKTKGQTPSQSQSSAAIKECKRQKQVQNEYQENNDMTQTNFIPVTTDLFKPVPVSFCSIDQPVEDRHSATGLTPLCRLLQTAIDEVEDVRGSPTLSCATTRNEYWTMGLPHNGRSFAARNSFRASAFFERIENRHDLTQEDLRDFEF